MSSGNDERARDHPGTGTTGWLRRRCDVLALGTIYVVVSIWANWPALSSRLVEEGDGAADSIGARSAWTQTSGIFSRWDFNHPGPVLFWLKWIGSNLGDLLPGVSTFGGQIIVNVIVAAIAVGATGVVLADATGRRHAVWIAFLLAALCGGGSQLSPWAPTTAHWFLLLGVAATAAVLLDRPWALPTAVGCGLAVVHLHLIYAPAGAIVIVAALVLHRRAHGTILWRAPAAVGAVMLAPMAVAVVDGTSSWGEYLEDRGPGAGNIRPWRAGLAQLGDAVTPLHIRNDLFWEIGRDESIAIMVLTMAAMVVGSLLVFTERQLTAGVVMVTAGLLWLAYLVVICRRDFIAYSIGGPIVSILLLTPVAARGGVRLPAVPGVAVTGVLLGAMLSWAALGWAAPPSGTAERAFATYESVGSGRTLVVKHLGYPTLAYSPAAGVTLLALRNEVDVCVDSQEWPHWADDSLICEPAERRDGVTLAFTDHATFTVVDD